MHSCGDESHEADQHGHSHGHGHSCCPEDSSGNSLLPYIDTFNIICLNEKIQDTGKSVFKSWCDKLEESKFVISEDDDPELLIHIPFTVAVKLKSFCLVGGVHGEAPSKVKLFINRDDIDFCAAQSMTPTQEFELAEDFLGEIDYPVKASKFQNISSLTMYIPENFGADSSRINFIGLKGEGTTIRRGVVECTYEASAQIKDHQTTRADKFTGSSELS